MVPAAPVAVARRLRLPVLLAAVLGLVAACDLAGGGAVPVLQGQVKLAAPQGYCMAPGQLREGQDQAVALFGRCNGQGVVAAALLSESLGRQGSGGVFLEGPVALAEFMGSTAGRKLMAQSGKAADVAILETVIEGDALLMRISDRKLGEYWRAFLPLAGRLVTVAATGPGAVDLTPDAGRKLVEATLAALRRANPARVATAPETSAAPPAP